MDKIDLFYKFIEIPFENNENNLLNLFISSNLIAYKMIITAIDKDEMKKMIQTYDKTTAFMKLSDLLLNQLRELDIEQYKIDICVTKLKYLVDKIHIQQLYKGHHGKFVGQEIFKDIVKMANEANLMESIKNRVRKVLSFKKIPMLIKSKPRKLELTNNLLRITTKGADLGLFIFDAYHRYLKIDGSRCNFYLYKTFSKSNSIIYVLRTEFYVKDMTDIMLVRQFISEHIFDIASSSSSTSEEVMDPVILLRSYIDMTDASSLPKPKILAQKIVEPMPEILTEWVVDIIANIIKDKYKDNDNVIKIFKNTKKANVKELKGLDDISYLIFQMGESSYYI
jgi:hypothetical protein